MVEKSTVESWVEGYQKAWDSNDPEDIGRLFSDEAAYYTSPFAEPWKGRQGIIENWLARKDEPGTYSFRYQVLAASNDTGVVRGWTKYFTEPEREYSNIWVIRFDGRGRSTEFTEWYMQRR